MNGFRKFQQRLVTKEKKRVKLAFRPRRKTEKHHRKTKITFLVVITRPRRKEKSPISIFADICEPPVPKPNFDFGQYLNYFQLNPLKLPIF